MKQHRLANGSNGKAVNPARYALHHRLCTLRPTPYILHPTPFNRHPTPYTLYPAPYTLHPTPCTLHPAPCTMQPTNRATAWTQGGNLDRDRVEQHRLPNGSNSTAGN